MVKKISICIIVCFVIFGAGFFAGRYNVKGKDDSKITEDISGISTGIGQASSDIGQASEGIKDAQGTIDVNIGLIDESKRGLDRCRELARELNEGLRGLQESEGSGVTSGAE